MATTGGNQNKRTLYVGGLQETVNPETLKAAFAPFGEIKNCQIPTDSKSGGHKGFGFVEFYDADDADAAIDNMHDAELFGRTLRVNQARERNNTRMDGTASRPVWADDFFYRARLKEQGMDVEVPDAE